MTRWLKILLLTVLIGFAKTHNFVKLVILAGLGLAGLWMVHTLAQDFNAIQGNTANNLKTYHSNNFPHNSGSEAANSVSIFKRSISESQSPSNQINWELVLSRDPASCARSFLCQLAALDEKTLSKEERLMLKLVR